MGGIVSQNQRPWPQIIEIISFVAYLVSPMLTVKNKNKNIKQGPNNSTVGESVCLEANT